MRSLDTHLPCSRRRVEAASADPKAAGGRGRLALTMVSAPVQVVFTPSGRRGRLPVGTTVLEAARHLGVDIDSVCGGRGICGRCQVTLGSAVGIPATEGRLSPPDAVEVGYRGRRPLRDGHRLACAARLQANAVIDVPPYSQVRRQVVRKRAEVIDMPVDPVVPGC